MPTIVDDVGSEIVLQIETVTIESHCSNALFFRQCQIWDQFGSYPACQFEAAYGNTADIMPFKSATISPNLHRPFFKLFNPTQ
jgi:hypothetical protein